MNKKRKISIRKVMQVLVTIVVTGACIAAITSASKIESQKHISSVEVAIKNSSKYHFIDKPGVLNMVINNRHIDISQLPISHLDIQSMEKIIEANPWVANAEVFVDNARVLHINVTQRVPVARIFENNGNSYYLDTTLSEVPLSSNYMYYTTIVTNAPELKNDSTGRALKAQIVSLVRYIESDTFWNAQISQIIMDSAMSFELVPVLGDQRILLGDTSMMKDKFENLFLFYKKVLNRIGWDKYEVLDLRFKDQVVASPTIPYKGHNDKAMTSMNWVKTIVEGDIDNKGENVMDTVKKVAGNNTATPVAAAKSRAGQTPAQQAPAREAHTPKTTVIPAKVAAAGPHVTAIKAKEQQKPHDKIGAAKQLPQSKEIVAKPKDANKQGKVTADKKIITKDKTIKKRDHDKQNAESSGQYIYRGQ